MKERPILFSGPMVRAILEGRKTQTRRIIKPQPEKPLRESKRIHTQKLGDGFCDYYFDAYCGQPKTEKNPRGQGLLWCWWTDDNRQCLDQFIKCPYGQPGDRLWIRESFCFPNNQNKTAWFRSDSPWVDDERIKWKPSIHMPRWASRITLEITDVRVERLQDISEQDCFAEGVPETCDAEPRDIYMDIWEGIKGKGSWEKNPWVWVICFKRVAP
ncbi:MAG TPA: hypothetical protein VHB73_00950 [Alphaproteobacteria bacterium]|nr:hypothetical protein [Alphaproteobacteria bacterium]